jgi:hypothetical protein
MAYRPPEHMQRSIADLYEKCRPLIQTIKKLVPSVQQINGNHARGCPGHPCLALVSGEDVDGRDKPSYDVNNDLAPK